MACTAVGFANGRDGSGVTLAERWNGAGWSGQRSSTPDGATSVQLTGVSCASPALCTAVGFFSNVSGIDVMLAEGWNGNSWEIERTLYPAGARYVQFFGVSCASASFCAAVGLLNNVTGFDVMLVEGRVVGRWTIERTPNPAGAPSNSLGAVSCSAVGRSTAVGSFTNSAGTGVTLAERYS